MEVDIRSMSWYGDEVVIRSTWVVYTFGCDVARGGVAWQPWLLSSPESSPPPPPLLPHHPLPPSPLREKTRHVHQVDFRMLHVRHHSHPQRKAFTVLDLNVVLRYMYKMTRVLRGACGRVREKMHQYIGLR